MTDKDEPFATFVEAFIYTQGSALALNFILMEVVRYLARQSGEPEKFLSMLYDGVYSRLDNEAADQHEKQAALDMRDTIDRFFTNARRWTT